MKKRANNSAERRFHVGDRVMLKNLKRSRTDEPLYSDPGMIVEVKDGCFTIELEAGGSSQLSGSITVGDSCFPSPLSLTQDRRPRVQT